MGKRSIKTTKSGKFMNPTDQWRKESRRRELKKNKKQRTAVREAVLRAKDHMRMLREIEEIEKIEMDSGPVPLPNEKSLKEKKRKLEETLSGVVKYLEKEDYKRASIVKGAILDSESRRRNMARVFRDYQTARSQINVADIPLPGDGSDTLSNIPLPGSSDVQPTGPSSSGAMVPPPPPPGPPPSDLYAPFKLLQDNQDEDELSDSEDSSDSEGEDEDEDEGEEEENVDEKKGRSVRFADDEQSGTRLLTGPPGPPPGLPPGMPPGPPPGVPPLMRPPPPPDGLPPIPPFSGPPGPPPGLPPHIIPPVMGMPPPREQWGGGARTKSSPAIISAGPTVSAHPVRSVVEPQASQPAPASTAGQEEPATISATPKLRNMKAEATKFMPTSLRVRRDNPKSVKAKMKGAASLSSTNTTKADIQVPPAAASKSMAQGDAYDAFMKEMSGLL